MSHDIGSTRKLDLENIGVAVRILSKCALELKISKHEPAVNLSHGMFHFRLKTYVFSKSFPP